MKIVRWSAENFSDSRDEWQKLLAQSDADKLFLSWAWMHNWWKLWGSKYLSELYILAVYEGNELVGLAPLYLSRDSAFNNWLKITRLEFLGSAYKKRGGLRTEYLQFIIRKDLNLNVTELLFDYIFRQKDWDKIVFTDLVEESETYKALYRYSGLNHCYSRDNEINYTYTVDCTGSFDNYLVGLGKNTRLKLFNQRKLLKSYGEVTVLPLGSGDIDKLVKWMDLFHKKRWGKPFFSSGRREFILGLLEAFAHDGSACSSFLVVAGEPISVILNLYMDGKIYNIQLGFYAEFNKKLSLGLLHLGYAIEFAFKCQNIALFDLLIGEGKKSNYKARLAKPRIKLATGQCIRRFSLKFAYYMHDKFYRSIFNWVAKLVSST